MFRRARPAAVSRSRLVSRSARAGLQFVAQGHQLIDLGDDAVLLGERWEGKGRVREILGRYAFLAGRAGHFRDACFDEVRALEKKQNVIGSINEDGRTMCNSVVPLPMPAC